MRAPRQEQRRSEAGEGEGRERVALPSGKRVAESLGRAIFVPENQLVSYSPLMGFSSALYAISLLC